MSEQTSSNGPLSEAIGITSNVIGTLAQCAQEGSRFTVFMLQAVRGVMTLMTAPFEMALRKNFGTLYINPAAWIINLLILHAAGLAAIFWHFHHGRGLIGAEILTPLYWGLSLYHLKRIWYLVEHPDEENDSHDDGDAWKFFDVLPRGRDAWRRIRVVYEPAFIFVIGITAYILHIFDLTATIFFVVGAIALAIKEATTWGIGWFVERNNRDARYRGELIAGKHAPSKKQAMFGSMPVPNLTKGVA